MWRSHFTICEQSIGDLQGCWPAPVGAESGNPRGYNCAHHEHFGGATGTEGSVGVHQTQ